MHGVHLRHHYHSPAHSVHWVALADASGLGACLCAGVASGIALLCASGVYALTDWPMNQLRKVVPPLRIGNFALDTGFLILILGVGLLLSVMTSLTLTFSR